MVMNRKKKAGAFETIANSIYLESVRRGTFVTFAVMAIISAGLGYFVYMYVLDGWIESSREYRKQVINKEVENKKTETMLAGETQFRAQFDKVVELYDEAKPLLPEETEVSDVLGQVETAASRNNVTLTGLSAVKESVKSSRQIIRTRNTGQSDGFVPAGHPVLGRHIADAEDIAGPRLFDTFVKEFGSAGLYAGRISCSAAG